MSRARLVHVTTVPISLAFVRGQAAYMAARGMEVHAISSPGQALERFAEQEHVNCHPVAMERRITPVWDVVALARLWWTLRGLRPVIVHSHTPKGGLLGMIGAWMARVPVRVYHLHGLPLTTSTGVRAWILRFSDRLACLLANRVICVSHSLRDVVIAERLCPASKITVLAGGTVNGVDAQKRFNPLLVGGSDYELVRQQVGLPAGAIVVGFVGRIVRDKGITELIQAWRRVKGLIPNAHLVFVGPFEPQDPLPSGTLMSLEMDPSVHLVGAVTDPSPYYRAMDLVVLPSYREGFPTVPLEAAAMELPVVATSIPGCVDAVQDGVTGTLVPPRDVDALAAAIERYLRDPGLRKRHGEAGRARVLQEFRQEVIWEALYDEYNRLLNQKGVRIPVPER